MGNLMSGLMRRSLAVALGLGMGLSSAALAEEVAKEAKPYPLKTCAVTDEPLGEMGEPAVIQHEGQEVKFCCAGCIDTFNKNPQKFMKKIDQAGKGSTTQPADKTQS